MSKIALTRILGRARAAAIRTSDRGRPARTKTVATRLPIRVSGLSVAAASSLFVATLRLAAPAAAQVQVPSELTVEEAISIALRNNPEQLRLLNDVDAADAQVRAEYGSFLPNVTLNTTFTSRYSKVRTAEGNFGEQLEQDEAIISKTSSSGQTIGLGSITLFDGGQQFRNVGTAKSQRHAAEAGVASGGNTLRANVTRAYYQVVNSERRIELEEQLLASARDNLELVQRQFEIAAARQTDLLGAQQDVAQREQAVADAESDTRAQRLNLLQLLGINGEPSFALVSDLPSVIDPATLDTDALVARAIRTHPTVRQAAAAADVAERQLSNQRGARLPTISLNLPSYSWGANEDGLWDAWGRFGAPNNSFSFGVSASLPVFTGFNRSAAIAQSFAGAEDARQQARQTRLEAEKNVRDALIELERAHRSLLLAEQQADISRQRLELAQEEYQTGAITFLDLQRIIESNDQTQRSLINARFIFLNARVSLEERLGGPLEG